MKTKRLKPSSESAPSPTGADAPAIKQIRLTRKQRLTLMEISNAGGLLERVEHDVSVFLSHLQLIEKRSRYSPAEKAARLQKRKADLGECAALARLGDIKALGRKVQDLDSHAYHDDDKAWFLTLAAQEYLIRGTVTIKTGSIQKAGTNAG